MVSITINLQLFVSLVFWDNRLARIHEQTCPSPIYRTHTSSLLVHGHLDSRRISTQPLLDGPARWPFMVLFTIDAPISEYAFGVIFTSTEHTALAIAAWGILGTLWWFVLGVSIDAAVHHFREYRRRNLGSRKAAITKHSESS